MITPFHHSDVWKKKNNPSAEAHPPIKNEPIHPVRRSSLRSNRHSSARSSSSIKHAVLNRARIGSLRQSVPVDVEILADPPQPGARSRRAVPPDCSHDVAVASGSIGAG